MSATGVAAPAIRWTLQWACPACKRDGSIQVIGQEGHRHSDEQVEQMLHESHRRKSEFCLRGGDRLIGRDHLWRLENGNVVWLLRPGETKETLHIGPWPPWERAS